MSSELEVTLRIKVMDCSDVVKALMVDEVNLPKGIRTSIECSGDELRYTLRAEIGNPRNVLSAWNTIDDLLRNLKAILSIQIHQ
jgi:hypothetical protein